MVNLVLLLETAEDGDRLLDRGFAHHHRLEAALERGVLLDVLAVLGQGGGADRPQLAARERRLEDVGRVHRALGGAGANQGVELVDEEDHLAVGVHDLLDHRLEPVLELAAILGAGDQGAHVERHQAPILEQLGNVARRDPLRHALGDRGLADPGLSDQNRVVLGASGEHLHEASDLLVAANDRVELAGLCELGEVAAVVGEGVVLVLRVGVGHAVRSPQFLDCCQECFLGDAVDGQRARCGRVGHRHDRHQQMLDRDILILELGSDLGRLIENRAQASRRLRLGPALDRRQAIESLLELDLELAGWYVDLGQKTRCNAPFLLHQSQQKVGRGGFRVAARGGGFLGLLDRFRGLDRVLSLPVH